MNGGYDGRDACLEGTGYVSKGGGGWMIRKKCVLVRGKTDLWKWEYYALEVVVSEEPRQARIYRAREWYASIPLEEYHS